MKTSLLLLLLVGGDGAAGWEEMRADLERRVTLELDSARRIARAEACYRKGVALLKAGDREGPAGLFARAEAMILDAGEDAYFQSSLRSYLHELRAKIDRSSHSNVALKPNTKITLAIKAPNDLVDSRTRAWLVSALSRPILEESRLRAIFRSELVPQELIYLGLVESEYRAGAVSPAGAVGPWQFMADTARRYGLLSGRGADDRRDLLKSARAAAQYLRDLYELLGDWTLAIAAYNAGEYRILRAMQKTGGKDFWALQHALPQETAQYVPRVLAAIAIARGIS